MKKFYEITIIGIGNIGFRYLEAILKIKSIKKINLIETNLDLLEINLSKVKCDNYEISKNDNITSNINNSDLIIVSTTSNERYEVCKKLQNIGYYGDLILEKFLFPTSNILEKSLNLFLDYPSKIFVNEWMRKTYLSKILNLNNIQNIEIVGDNLGLLCNSVHFIDLVVENLKINDFVIDTNISEIKKIIKTKRKGYLDICGKLVWKSQSNNMVFSLEDRFLGGKNRDVLFSISNESVDNRYVLSGDNLKEIRSSENYHIPYLSEHSKDSIIKILNKKDPNIPGFMKSISHHKLVFDSLKKIMNLEDYRKIKIT